MTRATFLLALPVLLASTTSMMATDLYLPAIPMLPSVLGGDAAGAQYTLAAFFASFAVGQLIFGALADLYDRRTILICALVAFCAASIACALAADMDTLIGLRAVQGLAASAGTALAPAILREAGDDGVVVRLISAVSSIQAVLPAVAPVLGAWLVVAFGWASTFWVMAGAAVCTLLAFQALAKPSPPPHDPDRPGAVRRYVNLLKMRRFMGYQLSAGFAFGGLIVFIMAAPYLLVTYLGEPTSGFVVMQLVLIVTFVVSANLAGRLTDRYSIDGVIVAGTLLQNVSAAGFLVLVLARPEWLGSVSFTLAMLPLVIGIGMRNGPGFARALFFAGPHTGSAGGLMMFSGMSLASLGTQIVAPYLVNGPLSVALAVVLMSVVSALILPLAIRPVAAEEESPDAEDPVPDQPAPVTVEE